MGETENNNKRDKEISVNVQVDRSFELEALRQENDSEILELRNTLTAIAERTLNEKCDRFKIDKSLSDDEKINAVKAKSLEHSNTALLNDAQTKDYSNSNNEATFDSIESGILELNEMAKTSEVIKKELCRTAKRALKPNNGTVFDYELEPFFLSSFAYPSTIL